jgi:hypothetical protein
MEISCDELHESSLSPSGSTDESSLFSLLEGEREILEYLGLVVAIGDILDFDGRILWGESGTRIITLHNGSIIYCIPKTFYIRKFFRRVLERFDRIQEKCLEHQEYSHRESKISESQYTLKYRIPDKIEYTDSSECERKSRDIKYEEK